MERIETSIGELLRPVILYFEDLSELKALFQELSQDVTVQTRTHKIETLDELLNLPQHEINELQIKTREPFVALSFQPDHIFLYASDDMPPQRGLFEKIKALLKSRERGLAHLENPLVQGALAGTALAETASAAVRGDYALAAACGLAGLLIGVWMRRSFHNRLHRFTIIRLVPRKESLNFLQRNRDRLILAFISAIVGAAIALGVRWLTGD